MIRPAQRNFIAAHVGEARELPELTDGVERDGDAL
jgi:hypothetical protein